MARLIDADALMDTIRQHEYSLATKQGAVDYGMFTLGIQQAVDEQPTVDAVPVVHGRWFMRGGIFRCSECDSKALLKLDGNVGGCREYTHFRSNYCPNCGADMRERGAGTEPDAFCSYGERRTDV